MPQTRSQSVVRSLVSASLCFATTVLAWGDTPPLTGKLVRIEDSTSLPIAITPDGLAVAMNDGVIWSPCLGTQRLDSDHWPYDISGRVQSFSNGTLSGSWMVGGIRVGGPNTGFVASVRSGTGSDWSETFEYICAFRAFSTFGVSSLAVGGAYSTGIGVAHHAGYLLPTPFPYVDHSPYYDAVLCPWWLPNLTFLCPTENPFIPQPASYFECSGFFAFNWKVSNDGERVIGMAQLRDPSSVWNCLEYSREDFPIHSQPTEGLFALRGPSDEPPTDPISAWPRPGSLRGLYSYVIGITTENVNDPSLVSRPYWLPGLPTGATGETAWQLSGDGSVAVGEASDHSTLATAVRWLPPEPNPLFPIRPSPTFIDRLDPEGLFSFSAAYATSTHGQVVGGAYQREEHEPARAFLFIEGQGMLDLEDYLHSINVDMQGWEFTAVTVISDDGGIIGGIGKFEGSTAGWYLQADCDSDGVSDRCQILSGQLPDCNHNLIADACDISSGTSLDCNGNGIPDECDVRDGTSPDCNGNNVPDECDLLTLDCNANGVPDDCECKIDLVIILDTSGSMQPPIDGLCQTIQSVVDALDAEHVDLSVKAYEITGGGGISINCLTTAGIPVGAIATEFGSDVPGLSGDPAATIADLCGGDGSSPFEAWADAIGIVAAEYPWRSDAGRVIVTISDECPQCGSPDGFCEFALSGPLFDRVDRTLRVVADINAAVASRSRPIRVYPVVPFGHPGSLYSPAVGQWGQHIADHTGGVLLERSALPMDEFAAALGDHLVNALHHACPKDCDFDRVPDQCEPAPPCCRWCAADFNVDNTVTIDDVFLFLNAWFANSSLDANCDGIASGVDEVFMFLNAWFAGCP